MTLNGSLFLGTNNITNKQTIEDILNHQKKKIVMGIG